MGQIPSTVCRRFEISLVAAKYYQHFNGGCYLAISIICLGVLLGEKLLLQKSCAGCVVVVKKCHQRPNHMVTLLMMNFLIPLILWQVVVGLWLQPFVAFPHHRIWMLSYLAPKEPNKILLGFHIIGTLVALIPVNMFFIATRCLIPRAPETYEKFGMIRVAFFIFIITLLTVVFVNVNLAAAIRPDPLYHKMECAVIVSKTEMPFVELSPYLSPLFAVYMIFATVFICYNGSILAVFRTAGFELGASSLVFPARLYRILFYAIIVVIIFPCATLMVNFSQKIVDLSFFPFSMFLTSCSSVFGCIMALIFCISIPTYRTYMSSCFSGNSHYQEESESERDYHELTELPPR